MCVICAPLASFKVAHLPVGKSIHSHRSPLVFMWLWYHNDAKEGVGGVSFRQRDWKLCKWVVTDVGPSSTSKGICIKALICSLICLLQTRSRLVFCTTASQQYLSLVLIVILLLFFYCPLLSHASHDPLLSLEYYIGLGQFVEILSLLVPLPYRTTLWCCP